MIKQTDESKNYEQQYIRWYHSLPLVEMNSPNDIAVAPMRYGQDLTSFDYRMVVGLER